MFLRSARGDTTIIIRMRHSGSLLPIGARTDAQGGFLFIALHPLRGAGGMSPHNSLIFLVTKGQFKRPTDQGMPILPRAKSTDMANSSQPPFWYHTAASPTYTSTLLDYCTLTRPYLPVHCDMIDRTSRWPEAIPLSSITATDYARALFTSWISSHHHIGHRRPVHICIVGPTMWAAPCISHSPTTAYHSQSNELVEWFHRQIEGCPAGQGHRRQLV
jgi:hypothetical protein